MHLGAVAAPADIAVEVLDVRGLQVAPAVLMLLGGGDVGADVAHLLAVLDFADDPAERAAVEIRLAAMVGEAVLELHAQRSAQRVQAEYRVGALQV